MEENDARFLLDPGSFSKGFEDLTGITAVLITHEHGDHLDIKKLKAVLAKNGDARVTADEDSARKLQEIGVESQVVHEGDKFELGGVEIEIIGSRHSPIHGTMPDIANVGYFIGGRFFYPGDALTRPGREIDILALPTAGPWMKLAEGIDYLLEVKPKNAIPAHESVSAVPPMEYGMIAPKAQEIGVNWRTPDYGQPVEF